MSWAEGKFDVVAGDDVGEVAGFTYNGLGLFVLGPAAYDVSAQVLLPNEWSVTHLNTGHQVCRLVGQRMRVMGMAKEIADCTDWEAFSSVKGWANTDPGLSDKISQLHRKFRPNMIVPTPKPNEESGRFVARRRMQ
jgi:hypothetical protein